MLIKEVGLRIQQLRKTKLNISQMDFAKKIGYDRTYLSRVESGKQNLTVETLIRICECLDNRAFFSY